LKDKTNQTKNKVSAGFSKFGLEDGIESICYLPERKECEEEE
jgi:hypothetical protein